ncbi:META domain-containing protein [Thiothrix subterranea]|uniref:META domain-containing protein n=1 Tax=Thiothrix subterranea TaxID=2735563 RepID=A0AA51R2H7_9GAMM|nr:META domain-containing protein [Thiothrix subterranea]MDQ5768322.1 META domain-containing protein [Thiothrix subterranea]QQZ28857.1 META domain-containing protein [Thiothrix subterranea]WML87849.1 META domain-containing protein [Thiothrix subterranea]
MTHSVAIVKAARYCRQALLLITLSLTSTGLSAEPDTATPPLPVGACPLNSGGSSLLGTQWRLLSVYGTPVPAELDISLSVGEDELKGFAGCNQYSTTFKRVGHSGFMMTGLERGNDICRVLPTTPGGPTINVGNWEGSYLRTLQRAGSVQQEGNTLHFYNRNGESSVVFGKKYGSL